MNQMDPKLVALIDVDQPEIGPITESDRNENIENSHRFRGSVRCAIGSFWTNDEFERFRQESLAKQLP